MIQLIERSVVPAAYHGTKGLEKIKCEAIKDKSFMYLFQRWHATGMIAYHGP